ncbi:MAG: leucyl/phenylalanyl-tRNA--protein transferase [Colwellia sp.]
MANTLTQLSEDNLSFPEVDKALTDPNGLLAIGGDLSTQRLVQAYHSGIFPWFNEGDPLLWWSPDPRTVIFLDDLRINKTLRKFINKSPYKITVNAAFDDVIANCANAPFRNDDTWIIEPMQKAYSLLHQQSYAHSIEVWQDDLLVGGLYGVAINGFFSGESMFYLKDNASKCALVGLKLHLESIGVAFIDCQLMNPFLADMGAINVSRSSFMEYQGHAINKAVPANFWSAKELILT